MTRPRSMTMMSSASRSASSRYCVVSSSVVPAVDERVEHLPQLGAGPRVEPGGRLVEEQHLRAGDERGGEVEAAAHAAGVARHHPVGGVGERELLEQLDGAAGRRPCG